MIIAKKSYEIQIENKYTKVSLGCEISKSITIHVTDENEINISATGSLCSEGIKALEQALKVAKVIAEVGFENFQLIDYKSKK